MENMDRVNYMDRVDALTLSQWNKILVYGATMAAEMFFWLWGLSTLSTLR